MSNLENNNKLNSNELSENELDNVSGGGIMDWFRKSDEKTAEGETQNQLAEGASETTQDGAAVLANVGSPTTTVPTGTDTVVTPVTPATVEQSLTGETQQSFSSGAGTNRGRKNRRSF